MVQALYIDPRGPYPALLGRENCWDEKRDARLYAGPESVVAHPPCGPWGALRHLYRGNEHDCAPRAVAQVHAYGGVLEHPRGSKLWEAAGLPKPGEWSDYNGFTVEVDQCAWGHVARKRTWLYIVGLSRAEVLSEVRTGGTPVPEGIKVRSAQQRRRTPPAFAEWLVSLAARCGQANDNKDQRG